MQKLFRSIAGLTFQFGWKPGLALILVFGIARFMIVLQANKTGNYNFTSLIFIVMAVLPFLLLNRNGWKHIGIKKPDRYIWLFYAFVAGALLAILIGFAGNLLYNATDSNWYNYISRSYPFSPEQLDPGEKLKYFLIFAAIAMTFSPVGEELLYRGLIHMNFVKRYGEDGASVIDSAAFALTHLAHFGIVFIKGEWHYLIIPGLIWVVFMFLTGRMFFLFRMKSGSIAGAILSHAGFNLGMMWFIFYLLRI